MRRGTSRRGYTQRSEPVSTRNCRVLILSVMKRRPVVAQTCAVDVYCFSYQQILDVVSPREGDLLSDRRLLKAGREFLGPGPRSLGLGSSSLKRSLRPSCLALSAATWRKRSTISSRSAPCSVDWPTLASAGWTSTSEMRSAQRAAASRSGRRGSSARCVAAG
jgi:hypothetical protein